ncbi:unnamed protein product [Lactuca virosa]|uniref:Uncharacterized protein n=1 Tax=Lactuca virosa TaxID=75947 RepID=A0AAU9NET1_9ASTR|nr:unnamed protein product [Lactuca virosa]
MKASYPTKVGRSSACIQIEIEPSILGFSSKSRTTAMLKSVPPTKCSMKCHPFVFDFNFDFHSIQHQDSKESPNEVLLLDAKQVQHIYGMCSTTWGYLTRIWSHFLVPTLWGRHVVRDQDLMRNLGPKILSSFTTIISSLVATSCLGFQVLVPEVGLNKKGPSPFSSDGGRGHMTFPRARATFVFPDLGVILMVWEA